MTLDNNTDDDDTVAITITIRINSVCSERGGLRMKVWKGQLSGVCVCVCESHCSVGLSIAQRHEFITRGLINLSEDSSDSFSCLCPSFLSKIYSKLLSFCSETEGTEVKEPKNPLRKSQGQAILGSQAMMGRLMFFRGGLCTSFAPLSSFVPGRPSR